MKNKRKPGYIPSVLDGSEVILDEVYTKSMSMPEVYDYSKSISPLKHIKDQGSTSKCVAYTLSYMLESEEWMNDTDSTFLLDIDKVYNCRSDKKEDGMQPKEALHYLKHTGYKINGETHHIKRYGMLKSELAIKKSLLINGPCLFALPCYNICKGDEFWKGSELLGGHAICCIGWTKDGFILQNSWGNSWANHGRIIFPFSDLKRLLEAWGIVM